MAFSLRTSILFLLLAVTVHSFSPVISFKSSSPSKTALEFGFLKELGLEKPSWLPDFGSKKDEPAADAESAESDETKGEEASAVEE
ncbi:hypothetical protein IV203_030111 [Nitzschia inconspicua]|uniref:Uncharacterized protein n=1 Tax=Nitzschia inconspicua TaxID=303405 RepID=A0A9K3LT08_9STRA|nr:hypothetical protein IV203_030111 [Nitzschia inconspicua]